MRFWGKKTENTNTAQRAVVESLYTAHHDVLTRFSARYMAHDNDVADVVQDVFVRLSSMENIQDICADPLPYLLTMTRNLIRDRYRRNHVRQAHKNSVQPDPDLASQQTPEHQLEWRQKVDIVAQCVTHLPPDIQRAFLLSRLKNMTYKEIAVDMRISERSARRYVAQALSVFKSRLEQVT